MCNRAYTHWSTRLDFHEANVALQRREVNFNRRSKGKQQLCLHEVQQWHLCFVIQRWKDIVCTFSHSTKTSTSPCSPDAATSILFASSTTLRYSWTPWRSIFQTNGRRSLISTKQRFCSQHRARKPCEDVVLLFMAETAALSNYNCMLYVLSNVKTFWVWLTESMTTTERKKALSPPSSTKSTPLNPIKVFISDGEAQEYHG